MQANPRFRTLSFRQGFGWLGRAAELMSQGGGALAAIAIVLLLVSMVQFLPVLGPIALTLISPLLTAGLITAFRLIDEGQQPTAGTLFAGWGNTGGMRLLLLGGWLLLGFTLAIGLWAILIMPQIDIDELNRLLQDPDALANNPDAFIALFEGVNLIGATAITAVILAIVLGSLYFAVPLVHFWQWPVVASSLMSLRALLVNWKAFLAFGLLLLAVMMAAGIMFSLILGILSFALGPLGEFISQVVITIATLFFQLLLAATQWVAFRQIFEDVRPGSEPEPSSDSDGQADSIEL